MNRQGTAADNNRHVPVHQMRRHLAVEFEEFYLPATRRAEATGKGSKQQQRDLSSPPPRSLQRNYRAVPHLANTLAGRAASPKKRRQVARPLPDSRQPGAFAWVLRPLCNGRRAMCGAQRLQRSLHSPTRPAVGRAARHLRGNIRLKTIDLSAEGPRVMRGRGGESRAVVARRQMCFAY